ncbi:MAG: DUF488 domain-containing protein [Rhodospirillaceae bacterium]|nr:DUF488 domain-containing protein [Rhodospirillaceae bacterium]
MSGTIFTIGHSNHPLATFVDLVRTAGVTAIADVRSTPYSRRQPQFNREPLARALKAAGVVYVYLGHALGGHPKDPGLMIGARPDYEHMAAAPAFCEGLGRVMEGAKSYTIALMCAEREPLDCHRCVLVARALAARGTDIRHVLADGRVEPHAVTEDRLLTWAKLGGGDLLDERPALLARAYAKRGAWMWGETRRI